MPARAMVIVGGGMSTRFGSDKLLAEIAGAPLIGHTLRAVAGVVDTVVVVVRAEIASEVAGIHPSAIVATGGATRTRSEWAGLSALGEAHDLIGIHDAARPVVDPAHVESVFAAAAETGGAVPVIEPAGLIVGRRELTPIPAIRRAQTPQVFRGAALFDAYQRAIAAGFDGHDTVEVMQRFADVTICAVPGDEANLKVTFPADLEMVRRHLTDRSRSEAL